VRDEGGVRFRGERILRRAERQAASPRKKTEHTEEGWNGNGRGLGPKGGVTPEEEHERSGDASVTELTLPCAFVRKRGSSFPRACTHAHVHAHAQTFERDRRTHARRARAPAACGAHDAVRFPPSWPPRGPSLSTLARYSSGNSYTRPSVPHFPPSCSFSFPGLVLDRVASACPSRKRKKFRGFRTRIGTRL